MGYRFLNVQEDGQGSRVKENGWVVTKKRRLRVVVLPQHVPAAFFRDGQPGQPSLWPFLKVSVVRSWVRHAVSRRPDSVIGDCCSLARWELDDFEFLLGLWFLNVESRERCWGND